jgi:hypothetical protein
MVENSVKNKPTKKRLHELLQTEVERFAWHAEATISLHYMSWYILGCTGTCKSSNDRETHSSTRLSSVKLDPPCYSQPRAADHWRHTQVPVPCPPTCCCRLEGRCPSTHSAPEPCLWSSLPVSLSRHPYCVMLHRTHSDIETDRRVRFCVFSDGTAHGHWFVLYFIIPSLPRSYSVEAVGDRIMNWNVCGPVFCWHF